MKPFLSFFLLGITTCYGQHKRVEFPDSGATFRYLLITKWVGHFTGVHVDFRHIRDTMVFDDVQDRLRKVMVFKGDGEARGYYAYASKDSSGAVWHCHYDDGEFLFFPWFDFNKTVGDKHLNGVVTKIDLMESQGISRRRMYFNNSKEPDYIEGVGDPEGFPFLFFYNGLISHIELLCFSVNDTVTYIHPPYESCDTTWDIDLSNSKLSGLSHRMVSLNGNQIWVETPLEWKGLDLKIQVFDVGGKLLCSESLNDSRAKIPMEMRNGVYLYLLRASGQPIERGKFLLAR